MSLQRIHSASLLRLDGRRLRRRRTRSRLRRLLVLREALESLEAGVETLEASVVALEAAERRLVRREAGLKRGLDRLDLMQASWNQKVLFRSKIEERPHIHKIYEIRNQITDL